MSKRKRLSYPIGPNETGSDPQFGNIIDLPKGLKRMTSVLRCLDNNTTVADTWSRLTFNFPECLGIKETLDNKARTTTTRTQCIPTVDMDVTINLPIIHDVRFEWVKTYRSYNASFSKSVDQVKAFNEAVEVVFILTGDDQIVKEVPDQTDPTKSWNGVTAYQQLAASNAIWAMYGVSPEPRDPGETLKKLNEGIVTGGLGGWLYGKTVSGAVGLDYADVAKAYLNRSIDNMLDNRVFSYLNNIPKGGYTLLKDHVNLFIKVPLQVKADDFEFEFRLIIDYSTRAIPLSTLLVWRQQLKEFIPKQILWRGQDVAKSATNNQWKFLISRGNVKESAVGNDPSDKTKFPDIDD